MAINISGSFVDDTTPMTGNMDGVPHFGIQGPPGPQGAPGGYYVPAIDQTGENELEVSFSPSLPDMPYVAPVKVTVTPDPDSGGNVDFQTDETLTLKNGILSVNTTNDMEQDNTLPITSAGVFATVGNIEALLKTI
jgi:hypothetical protein